MLSITKLQNLKAIHNYWLNICPCWYVVINHKTTKFESNSQRCIGLLCRAGGCYQSQNYKIWKQFTTTACLKRTKVWLLSITKLQNLKAIHNIGMLGYLGEVVVINHKTTKFESNSQLGVHHSRSNMGCYQSQNYKIWKQFTTNVRAYLSGCTLLSITKLQNLKAIHNRCLTSHKTTMVVINRKTTKFESNSQLRFLILKVAFGCYQSQNYKIWKQFTT